MTPRYTKHTDEDEVSQWNIACTEISQKCNEKGYTLPWSATFTYVAEYCSKLWVCGRDDQNYNIQVENYSSQSNQVVEVRTGESNQSVGL